VLAQGTLTEDDLVGPLASQEFATLVDAMVAGNAYVNVHTDDGVAAGGSGPGEPARRRGPRPDPMTPG
jgi:hypothetical protein